MTTGLRLCLLSSSPWRKSGSWQEKDAKREKDFYKGPFTKVQARGRRNQQGGKDLGGGWSQSPKRVERASGQGLGPQGEDLRESRGLCPAGRELGKFPNLWAGFQTHPEARGEWGMGPPMRPRGQAMGREEGGSGGKPGTPRPLLCPHLFHSRTRIGHLTIPHPPVLFFFLPCPLAPRAL